MGKNQREGQERELFFSRLLVSFCFYGTQQALKDDPGAVLEAVVVCASGHHWWEESLCRCGNFAGTDASSSPQTQLGAVFLFPCCYGNM